MADPQPVEIRKISLEAALSVAGRPPDDVEVDIRLDSSNELAYFITLQFEADRDPPLGPSARVPIGRRIRDALIAAGDEHYPFVRFLARDDWDARTRARSV